MLVAIAALLVGCQRGIEEGSLPAIPAPSLDSITNEARDLIREFGDRARANPTDGPSSGRFGMALHAYELNQASIACYRRAIAISPSDWQCAEGRNWPMARPRLHGSCSVDRQICRPSLCGDRIGQPSCGSTHSRGRLPDRRHIEVALCCSGDAQYARFREYAIFATARELAQLVYRMRHWGQEYVDEGVAANKGRYRQRTIAHLKTSARDLGCYWLVLDTRSPPTPEPASASPA